MLTLGEIINEKKTLCEMFEKFIYVTGRCALLLLFISIPHSALFIAPPLVRVLSLWCIENNRLVASVYVPGSFVSEAMERTKRSLSELGNEDEADESAAELDDEMNDDHEPAAKKPKRRHSRTPTSSASTVDDTAQIQVLECDDLVCLIMTVCHSADCQEFNVI
jgi:hypothetical protein